jgi:hypothetical protein
MRLMAACHPLLPAARTLQAIQQGCQQGYRDSFVSAFERISGHLSKTFPELRALERRGRELFQDLAHPDDVTEGSPADPSATARRTQEMRVRVF